MLLCLTGARADTAIAGRTAFLREGPGIRYRSLDEVLGGATVEVMACEAGWCRVRSGDATGYVPDGVLQREPPRPNALGPSPTCFVNGQTGYHGTRPVEFCHPSTAP